MEPIYINGNHLLISDLFEVIENQRPVALTQDTATREQITRAQACVSEAVAKGLPIYGITTLFGGLADHKVSPNQAGELQQQLILAHHADVGELLEKEDVKAAMLIRANTLSKGASGVSIDLIYRYLHCLNKDFTPMVKSFGSIGASGDLIPLATIAGAVLGLTDDYQVWLGKRQLNAIDALSRIGLEPYTLKPKEGLALINGTALMAGMEARNLAQFDDLFQLNLSCHALCIQALLGNEESFDPFIHQHKPHPGQIQVATWVRSLLADSQSLYQSVQQHHLSNPMDLLQDRYSLRCLAQFMGPIVERFQQSASQLTTEINSTTDNPLIDTASNTFLHGGNFLGQYTALSMDHLRLNIALLTKHMDAQIALLMTPQFSRGLSPALIGNTELGLNVGLKPLQIAGNSILPLIEHLGNAIADRFPTHAEQFNQNINSQGIGACYQTRKSLELWRRYQAIVCIIVVQAVDLRTYQLTQRYDAACCLSSATLDLYKAIKHVLGVTENHRPLVWNDDRQCLSHWVQAIYDDLNHSSSHILDALPKTIGLLTDPA